MSPDALTDELMEFFENIAQPLRSLMHPIRHPLPELLRLLTLELILAYTVHPLAQGQLGCQGRLIQVLTGVCCLGHGLLKEKYYHKQRR